ncbi:low-specificity L-threonine aldolase [Pelagibius sp. Alg239-R121]|uniref:low-specificity L-threonine aldolase n=1 Tax=Pelagibius sp. Alg239-R121 TaxID=2993448 RepID=UPI0024A6DC19|nr:low-specificity L-threonine aldolase [Pelagibius sp. Alg239-R121]
MAMYEGMKADQAAGAGSNRRRMIDLRSDTVTRPSAGMRQAMADAEVGDDVYGEDPTVDALQAKAAELLGKEAGLFLPTGTQSNLVGLMTHCQRGEEYIVGDCYHIFHDEAAGAAVLASISPCPLITDDKGGLSVDAVQMAIKADDPHYAISRLVCLENTVSGRVQDQDTIDAIAEMAHNRGMSVHLDGARLMNAAVASNCSPAHLARNADTVSLCLSKGLGTPVGSVLCGPRDFINRAFRARKMLGGAMRQVGVLAACGLYALEHNIERLADDHRRATRMAEGLSRFPSLGVTHDPDHTNMLFVEPRDEDHAPLLEHLAGEGIVFAAQKPAIRLVTHLDISDEDVETVITAVGDYYAKAGKSLAAAGS